jgi:hypothetical protein
LLLTAIEFAISILRQDGVIATDSNRAVGITTIVVRTRSMPKTKTPRGERGVVAKNVRLSREAA